MVVTKNPAWSACNAVARLLRPFCFDYEGEQCGHILTASRFASKARCSFFGLCALQLWHVRRCIRVENGGAAFSRTRRQSASMVPDSRPLDSGTHMLA
jgi:hypothetical protein